MNIEEIKIRSDISGIEYSIKDMLIKYTPIYDNIQIVYNYNHIVLNPQIKMSIYCDEHLIDKVIVLDDIEDINKFTKEFKIIETKYKRMVTIDKLLNT